MWIVLNIDYIYEILELKRLMMDLQYNLKLLTDENVINLRRTMQVILVRISADSVMHEVFTQLDSIQQNWFDNIYLVAKHITLKKMRCYFEMIS